MLNRELLKKTEHRPWPTPTQEWKFSQEWNNVIFLHWQVNEQLLYEFIPATLKLDSFEGTTWISLVAFTMERVRLRLLPSFSPISNFDEINIRTYVTFNGQPGVYFLSIEAGKHLSTWIAKTISGLPYRYSSISRTSTNYHSTNSEYKASLSINFDILQRKNKKTKLEKWLTERYALFHSTKGDITKYEIHHLEWSIEDIRLNKLECKYPRFSSLLAGHPNLAHWSKGVKVIAWDKVLLATKGVKNQ